MKITLKRSPYGLVPADEDSQRLFNCLHLNDCIELDYEHVGERTRTDQQRKALEVFCRLLAEELNAKGIDMLKFPWREGVALKWTQSDVKERIWKPLQKVIIDKQSTTEANTKEYSEVYKILLEHMATEHGFAIPAWPSRFGPEGFAEIGSMNDDKRKPKRAA